MSVYGDFSAGCLWGDGVSLMGAFTAWVYNLVAARIGGIRLELRADAANYSLDFKLQLRPYD